MYLDGTRRVKGSNFYLRVSPTGRKGLGTPTRRVSRPGPRIDTTFVGTVEWITSVPVTPTRVLSSSASHRPVPY